MRDYLIEADIAHSVAHATYSVNGRLDIDILEKLILLFNVFEAVNGARNAVYNRTWTEAMKNLTPGVIATLQDRHRIAPVGDHPWQKGFTGGSDDHAGLFMGETFTLAEADSLPAFLAAIGNRRTVAGGRDGNHKALSFAIYKIACDYSMNRSGSGRDNAWTTINRLIFQDGRLRPSEWLKLRGRRWRRDRHSQNRILARFIDDLTAAQGARNGAAMEPRIDRAYDALANVSDDYFKLIANSLEKDVHNGDAARLLKNAAAALPAMFLAAPFFSALRHLHHDRSLLNTIRARFTPSAPGRDKRVLWFSDTVTDLNGVSVTMQELAACAHRTQRPLAIVTTLPAAEYIAAELPPTVINLPCIYTFTPAFYDAFTLRVPSLLQAIDRVARLEPDEIVVSTPGPVGLIGLVAARLLDVKCTGIYHTDFTRQADHFIGDEQVSALIEDYTRVFFRLMDEVRVPTQQYVTLLTERGLDPARMTVFSRSIDAGFAVINPQRQVELRDRFGLNDRPVMLWAGRVGAEKNLDFLLAVATHVQQLDPDAALVVVGEGPELPRLRQAHAGNPGIIFTGRVNRSELPHYYGMADVFVFPSTTDTFGMVVLEAQACGLPAIVTNVGGPQEIVRDGETGTVLPVGDAGLWAETVLQTLDRLYQPASASAWRRRIRNHFQDSVGWDGVLDATLREDYDHAAGEQPAEQPAREAVA